MNNYYYSQKYGGYAKEVIIPGPIMSDKGCAITCAAMLISYFNDSALYPDDFLHWLHEHNGLTSDGRLLYESVCKATNYKLRMSTVANPKLGETIYCIREVWYKGRAGQQHFVFDHPSIPGKVIDPIDGSVKNYTNEHTYTGKNIFFIGKR